MRAQLRKVIPAMIALFTLNVAAVTHYVDLNSSSPTPPYTNWPTAATNIQDAIDAAEPGDEVLVTNGVYAVGGRVVYSNQATNRIAITKPLLVQSVNGPGVTVIEGYKVPRPFYATNAVRCAYLTNGAMLSGFTLTNGSTRDLVYQDSGGGVRCESASAVVSNCVLIGNAASYEGGGACQGTLIKCTLMGNSVYGNISTYDGYGGGASSAILNGCLVVSNSAPFGGGAGIDCVFNNCTLQANTSAGDGGAAVTSILTNCTVTGNRSARGGGTAGGTVVASTIVSNSASDYGGGAFGGSILNSIITGNTAPNGGGVRGGDLRNCAVVNNAAISSNSITLTYDILGGGLYQSDATNCTITGNSALRGGGAASSNLRNCILYHNYAAKYANLDNHHACTLDYCCTTPQPAAGSGNIVSDPQLLDPFHVHANSPCLSNGNAGWLTGTDIDGETWKSTPAIGCDEYYSGAVTGLLSAAISLDYTNVGRTYPVSLAARVNGRPSAVRWDFGDGVVISNRAYVSHGWTAAGNYPVVLTVYNDSFTEGISATTMIQVIDQVHYVSPSSPSPTAPYLSWATAAMNIQQAINAASVPGALVLVSNGVYSTGATRLAGFISNRLAVTKPLIIQSVNGPTVSTIRGSYSPTVRGVYLTNGAVLNGFTIANGSTTTSGGDIWYDQAGGGIYCESSHAIVTNCVIINGRAAYQGGGLNYGTLSRGVLSNNNASFYGGGAFGSALNNLLVISNYGGTGGGAYNSRVTNCTIVANGSGSDGGGVYGGTAQNSILYLNVSGTAYSNYAGADLNYCCTMPLALGSANFTNAPVFVNQAARNFRLQTNSPCISGGNNSFASAIIDLDGRPRIVGGTVDVGAYEYQGPGMGEFIGWLQQYILPTDGSADYMDSDNDGANNWQEWRADTIPTNTLSALRMVTVTNAASGLNVTWRSVSTRSYFLECATNLNDVPPFQSIATNIAGVSGTKTYTDPSATNGGPYFYRVGVQ